MQYQILKYTEELKEKNDVISYMQKTKAEHEDLIGTVL